MADEIRLGTLTLESARAEAAIRAVEAKLGTTIDRAKGLGEALKTANAELAKAEAEGGKAARALGLLEQEEQRAAAAARGVAEASRAAAEASRGFGETLRRIATADLGSFAQNAQRAFHVNQVVAFARSVVGVGTSLVHTLAAAEAHERAVRTLGRSYQDVQRQTAGVVTAEQALRVQQTLVQSGLRVSASELGVITRAAREYATANGAELQPSLDQLTDALRNGEAGGLRRFGVALGANTTRARAFDATIRTLTTTQRGHAVQTQTLAERMTTLGTTFTTAAGQIATFITNSTGLGRWLSERINQVGELVRSMGELAARDTENARPNSDVNRQRSIVENAENLARDRAGLSDQLQRLRAAGVQVNDIDPNAFRQERLGIAGTGAMATRLRATLRAMRLADTNEERVRIYEEFRRGAFAETVTAANASRAAESRALAPPPETADGGSRTLTPEGGGAGGGGDDAEQMREAMRALEASRSSLGFLVGGERSLDLRNKLDQHAAASPVQANAEARRRGESALDYTRRLTEANRELIDVLRERYEATARGEAAAREQITETLDAMARGVGTGTGTALHEGAQERDRAAAERRERMRAIVAEDEAQRRRRDVGAQMTDAFEAQADRQLTAAQRLSTGVRGAFDAMTGAVSSHYAALVEGRESAGEALKGILHDTLLSIGQQAVVRSLFETAQGIANLAAMNYPGAAQNFAAAGVFAGVAVLAGIGAAATNPSAAVAAHGGGASAGGAGGFGGGVRHASGGGETRAVVYTINVNGALSTREDIQDAVVAAHDRAGIRGVRPRSEIMAARRRAA